MVICSSCIRITDDSEIEAVCHESNQEAVRHQASDAGAVGQPSGSASSHDDMAVDSVTPMTQLPPGQTLPQTWPHPSVYQASWHGPMPLLMMQQRGLGDVVAQFQNQGFVDDEHELPPPPPLAPSSSSNYLHPRKDDGEPSSKHLRK